MSTTTANPASKLDFGLERLVGEGSLDESSQIPIVIRVVDESAVDAALQLVRELPGKVRHVLMPLRAVSAWVELGSIRALTEPDFVSLVELAQTDMVARA
ncbi:MAG TPA: hypothetical protein VKB18_03280 [Gemmatimonadota bacterium]|nr:hypothetical protein [Gemmatimonadota bacterium]